MLDGQRKRVDILAHAGTACDEKDWKGISAESSLMSLRRLNLSRDWTEPLVICIRGALQYTIPHSFLLEYENSDSQSFWFLKGCSLLTSQDFGPHLNHRKGTWCETDETSQVAGYLLVQFSSVQSLDLLVLIRYKKAAAAGHSLRGCFMAVARDSRQRHYYHQHALQSERLHRLHAYAGRSLVVLVLGASLPQILTKLPSRNAGYHHHHHHHHLPLPRKPYWYTVHVHSTEIKSLSLWYIPLQFAFFLIIFILFYLFAVASGNETWEGGGVCACVLGMG